MNSTKKLQQMNQQTFSGHPNGTIRTTETGAGKIGIYLKLAKTITTGFSRTN